MQLCQVPPLERGYNHLMVERSRNRRPNISPIYDTILMLVFDLTEDQLMQLEEQGVLEITRNEIRNVINLLDISPLETLSQTDLESVTDFDVIRLRAKIINALLERESVHS